MRVHLVPPSIWKPALAKAAKPSDSRLPRLAHVTEAVLWTLQDAHVGITPSLSAQLATLVLKRGGAHSGVWPSTLHRLQETLSGSSAVGVTASANWFYLVLKVVKPIVREATERLGRSCLLCRDEIDSTITLAEYGGYDTELAEALRNGLRDEEAHRLFFLEHGGPMSPRPRTQSGTAMPRCLPEVDSVGTAMLFGLPEHVAGDRWQRRQAPSPTFVPRNRPSPGAHEERIEGIRESRRERDLGAMIPSEYLFPWFVRAERMVSGFLIYERRPHREKLRDVLVVGIMPREVRATLGGTFAKACWADCMARLGRRLAEAKLLETEFRWIEGDAMGRARHCSFLLRHLRRDALATSGHETFRRDFLTGLRWLPDFFDVHPGTDARGVNAEDPEKWPIAAWKDQKESPEWGAPALRDHPAARFSFVHVMVFLPPRPPKPTSTLEAATSIGNFRAGFGLGARERRNVSVTYTPMVPSARTWGYTLARDTYRAVGNLSMGDPGKLADELESTWLTELTREIWHG